MSTRTDTVNLVINVNGNAAQNQLNELRKRAADLTFEMKNNLKKGTQEYITAAGDLKKVNADMLTLKQSIGIAALSMKELSSERSKLTALVNSSAPLSKEWKDYNNQLQSVITRQNELKTGMAGVGSVSVSSFNSLKQGVSSLLTSYVGLFAIISGTKALITGAVKLSDQLGDLRRVAGLTKDEATDLNHALLQIDTRTSGAGLLNIAIIAGKLGVAKEDIFSFTQSVDKLVVTLGDELGGADEITTQLGKILNVFDGKVTGENISFLGNAIVDLANKGVATGGYIVDFTQRVSGIAKASNISLGATVGLAAGFESLGLRSESSATALQKLLLTISQDMPKAAKIAGMPLKDFNDLFANKPQEALLKYTEGLVKNKTAFSDITTSFKDAGESGARVVQTILAIGQNADFMRGQINQGNESIKQQTALNDGFAIKNENLAGSIDRLGKSFDRLVANNKVTAFLMGIVNVVSGAVEGVNKLIESFDSLDEQRSKALQKQDQDQNDLAEKIVKGAAATKDDPGFIGMSQKTLEEQQKLADSYKEIYISSRKALADFLNSSDKDNLIKRKNLILQAEQDGKIFVATQKQLKDALESASKETSTGGSGSAIDPNSVAARRTQLEGMIEDSKAAYEKLNTTDKAGQQANLSLRAKYQAELDSLDNKAQKAASKNSEYSSLLKEADAFYKQIQKLKEDAINASKSDDEKDLANLQEKYKEMQAKALDFFQKNVISRGKYNEEEKALIEAFNQELETLQKKQFEKISANEYDRALQDTKDYFDEQRNLEGQNYAEGKINKAQYDGAIAQLDIDEKKQLVTIGTDYSKTVKKADSDLHNYKKDLEKATTQDAIEQAETRVKNAKAEALAKAQLAVIAAPEGSVKRDNAQKELYKKQFDQDTEFLDKKSAAYKLAEQKLNDALAKIDDDAIQRKLKAFDDLSQQILSISNNFITALNNLDQRELQKDTALNNAKKNNYKKQLDEKLLSQKQYDLLTQKADNDLAKQKHELDMKAFKRQKALAITAALINGALAVTATLAARPGLADIFTLGVARAIQVGLVIAATAGQVAAIASQAPPELGQGGLIQNGPYHKDTEKGLPVIDPRTGKTELLLEKGEGVVKGDAMRDKKKYTVTGTPSQIASKLNSMHGGVNWAAGATLKMPKFRERGAQLNTNLPLIMAEGGLALVRRNNEIKNPIDFQSLGNLIDTRLSLIENKFDSLIGVTKDKNESVHAVVSIKEYRDKEKQYDTARKAAGINQ